MHTHWLVLVLFCLFNPVAKASTETLKQASQLAKNNQQEDAIALLIELSEQNPDSPEPLNNLAVIEAQRGNFTLAQEYLKKALKTQTGFQTSYENLLSIQKAEALSAYRKSLDLKNTQKQGLKLKSLQSMALMTEAPAKEIIIEKPVEVVKYIEVEKEVLITPDCPKPEVREVEKVECPAQSDVSNIQPSRSVKSVIQQWATDWANQDVNRYVRHYIKNYSQNDQQSHVDWIALRRQRLTAPNFIKVDLRDLQIDQISPSVAVANFIQHYQSNTINDAVNKMLVLVVENDSWKIQRERVLR